MDTLTEETLTALAAQQAADPSGTFRGARPGAAGDATMSALPTDGTLPTWSLAAGTDGPAAQPTAAAGVAPSYRLLKPIARGGMGDVWEAVQTSLGRVVAVKQMRARPAATPGSTDEDDSRRRLLAFRQEALVAARLEHPNIVPVHDQGLDDQGEPLLAMKRVHGEPWNDLIRRDFGVLAPEEFLARHLPILVDMVQAVVFAHSQGVVHRDLKPSQVMVGSFGEVLLMDWGLALYVGEPKGVDDAVRRELPIRRTSSSPSGTPAFMAPEQTLATPDGIMEQTDVYLIGGTLYMLLTGEPPHAGRNSVEAFKRATEGRVPDPRERAPGRTHPPELAALCMACLQPVPADRPDTAAVVLDALNDYLTGAGRRREATAIADAVEARLAESPADYREIARLLADLQRAAALFPESTRLAPLRDRLLARHAQLALERGDLHLARLQLESMSDEAEAARGLTEADRLEARRRRQHAQRRAALAAAIVLLLVVAIGGAAFSTSLRRERDAAQEARASAEQQRDEANGQRLRAEEAEDVAAGRLAEIEQKAAALRASRSDAQSLATFMLTDLRSRLASLDRLDLLDAVAEQTLAYYRDIPFSDLEIEEMQAVLKGLVELASLATDQGNLPLTRQAIELAMDSTNIAIEQNPGSAQLRLFGLMMHKRRALVLIDQGDLVGAAKDYEHMEASARVVLDAAGDAPWRYHAEAQLADALGGLASIARARRDLPAAEQLFRESIVLQEGVVARDPEDFVNRRELARQVNNLSSLLAEMDREEEAIVGFHQSSAISEQLALEHPDNNELLADYAQSLHNVGTMMLSAGDVEGGLAELARSSELLDQLIEREPDNVNHLSKLATLHYQLGRHAREQGDFPAFESNLQRASELFALLAERDPTNLSHQHAGVVARFQMALHALDNARDYPRAKALLDENVRVLRDLTSREPTNAFWRRELNSNLLRLNYAQMSLHDYQAAAATAHEALALNEQILANEPLDHSAHDQQAALLEQLGLALHAQGKLEDAVAAYQAARAPLATLRVIKPDNYWQRWEAHLGTLAAWALVEKGDLEAARGNLQRAVDIRDSMGDDAHTNAWVSVAARIMVVEATILAKLGQQDASHAMHEEAVQIFTQFLDEKGLRDMLEMELVSLVRATQGVGHEPDPAWIEELRARGSFWIPAAE